MMNLFDLMRQAQGGDAFGNLSSRLGLSMEETQKAVAALVPAFAMGLQRSAARPEAMADLMRLMAQGAFKGAYQSPQTAFSPRTTETGADALAALFGSPDYAKRIGEHAATLSGVAGEATAKMMPVLAAMMMDGMAQASEAGQAAARSASAPAASKPSASKGTGRAGARTGAKAPPPPANPWEDMFSAMMGAPRPEPQPEPEPEPARDPQAAAQSAFAAYERMIGAGRDLQDAQIAMMRAMMEEFWGRR